MLEKKRLTKEQALQKIRHFAGYQERCHQEVKDKLYSFGLYGADVEELVARMIEENYLNEERFATMYAGGKFRLKNWGRVKIRYELKQKRISDYCISIGLKAIDEKSYRATIEKIAQKKWNSLSSEKNQFTKTAKTLESLIAKGFEAKLVREILSKLASGPDLFE
ncbi:MAG TPA: regulatory protein RecX [Flavitalea sp.]|nr:regulatory protein RecX [Flavitalea sp.]